MPRPPLHAHRRTAAATSAADATTAEIEDIRTCFGEGQLLRRFARVLAEFTREAVFEQSYFALLLVQRWQQVPSDKSRFTIPDRARDDDDAAVVGQGVSYFLWHPPFVRSRRAAAGVRSQKLVRGFEE